MAERLTGMDSTFLNLETRNFPQHVMGVMMLDTTDMDEPFSFDLFRTIILDRIHLMGPLRKRYVDVPLGLDHGVWFDADDFEIDEHLHHVHLEEPRDMRTLEAFVGRVAGTVLDRERPLWQMWVVEDIEGGQVAVITKMHHAIIDGASGADLMAQLFDLTPEQRDVEPPDEEYIGEAEPHPLLLAAGGLREQALNPLRLARQVVRSSGAMFNAAKATGGVAQARKRLRKFAPRAPWSGALSDQRVVAFTRLDLEQVKAVKNHHGGKVNDVLLAISAQSFRRYLEAREELPDKPLLASVPVSVRADDSEARNEIATMIASLPVQIEDPVEQLHTIVEETASSKAAATAMGTAGIADWTELTAPTVIRAMSGMYAGMRLGSFHPPIHNAVISNVQGPPLELYIAGAKVTGVFPMGPLIPGAGVNITCLSNMGNIDVGVLADGATVDAPWEIADGLVTALDELVATLPD